LLPRPTSRVGGGMSCNQLSLLIICLHGCALAMGAVRTSIMRLIGRFSSPVCISANEADAAEVLAVNEQAYDMESEGVLVPDAINLMSASYKRW